MSKFPAITRKRAALFRILLAAALLAVFCLATTRLDVPVSRALNDKANHALAFFVLALLVDFSFPAWTFRTKVLVLIAYGLSIEITQAYLPYRSCSLFDLGADAVGVGLYGICQRSVNRLGSADFGMRKRKNL